MPILTVKVQTFYAVQWNGESPLYLSTPHGDIQVDPGNWIAEYPDRGDGRNIKILTPDDVAAECDATPDHQADEIVETGSVKCWVLLDNGKVFDRDGHICAVNNALQIDDLATEDTSRYSIVPMILSPITKVDASPTSAKHVTAFTAPPSARPNIAGEVWAIVRKDTRLIDMTYTSRERAETVMRGLDDDDFEIVFVI